MEFKKYRRWTKPEDEIIKGVFPTIPFSSHYPHRWRDINDVLKANGFTDRTQKAISRRSYRLGLRSHLQTHKEVKDKCHLCGVECMRKPRYNVVLCEACRLKQKYAYAKTPRGKKYHAQYFKKWRENKRQ